MAISTPTKLSPENVIKKLYRANPEYALRITDVKGIPLGVSAYYEKVPSTHKATFFEMRARILEVIPSAEEVIKYGMPTFIFEGIAVAGLLANKNHVGYYPYSGSVISEFPDIAQKYETTKGSIHIPLDKTMSKSEVKQLIKARLKLGKKKAP